MKRRHNKDKTVKKRKTRCGPDCGKMPIVKPHPEAGVYHICRKCKRKVRVLPNGYTTEEKKPGIKHKPSPEKAKEYAKKQHEKRKKALDAKLGALITNT